MSLRVNHKLLTKAQEQDLAKRCSEGDEHSREMLITHNMRLALSIAHKYSKSGLSMEDLSQESFVGLIKAVDRFDYKKGFRFSTYACWWIKQAIRRAIASQTTSPVKFPAGSRHMIFKINQLRDEYNKEFGAYPDDAEVADLLGVTADSVSNLRVGMQWPINIDKPIAGDEGGRTYAEVIPDESLSPDEVLDQKSMIKMIKKGLASLTKQEEQVMRLRFGITEDPTDDKNFPITNQELSNLKNS